jgi:release factor glutamine methyltransferase
MFYYMGITLSVPERVYCPRGDSLLLAGVLEKMKPKGIILDMGCGSGFLAILIAKSAEVTAVDINPSAVRTTLQNAVMNNVKLKALQSDLFKKVKGRFDFIVFNPPYLPAEEDKTYSGGKTGRAVIIKFIKHAGKYLKKNGRILLLISSLTGEKEVLELFRKNNFRTKIITRQKIPWEELLVIEARSC